MQSVSVAMATYNGGRFLKEQLDSIASQSVLPLEVVISDDCSTDDTLEVAEQFSKAAPFAVRIHRNSSTVGYTRNFRTAVSLCSGELIAFCDQDDWWCPNRLEICLPHFGDPDLQLLYHNALVVDELRRKVGELYKAETENHALSLKPIGPWNYCNGLVQIFRAELRQYDDLWDKSVSHVTARELSHDRWYFFLAQVLGRVEFLDRILIEYRQHGSNTFGAARTRAAVQTRFFSRVSHHGGQDIRSALAADSRARILRMLEERAPGRSSDLLGIAHRYEVLAERNRRRYHAYCGAHFGWRLRSLVRSWTDGDYSGWPWGFDKRSVIRDLWAGVVRARC